MTSAEKRNYATEGQRSYEEWRDNFLADPENRRTYEEEVAKKELCLQFVEARQAAGMTQVELAERLGVSQAQVARIEKRGYDAYTLNTLRRYVQALGEEFAEFWDTHSLADYWEHTEPADFEIDSHARRRYLVALDPELLLHVQILAQSRGLSTESLVNLLLEQRIHQLES